MYEYACPNKKQEKKPSAKSVKIISTPVNSTVIQSKLKVGATDYSREYAQRRRAGTATALADAETYLTQTVDAICTQIEAVLEEPQKTAFLAAPANEKIRNQLKKWIVDAPGDLSVTGPQKSLIHNLFGTKRQNRAYANFKDLGLGLLGWVSTKDGRKQEGALAKRVYKSDITSLFLDSLIHRIHSKVDEIAPLQRDDGPPISDKATAIRQELSTGLSTIEPGKQIGHYKKYEKAKTEADHAYAARVRAQAPLLSGEKVWKKREVPANQFEIMSRPEEFTLGAKIRFLHDLMEYFGPHQRWNPRTAGNQELPALTEDESRITIGASDEGERTLSVPMVVTPAPPSGDAEVRAAKEAEKKARGMGLTTSTRDESAPSTKFARRLGIPIWAGQSMTTARMMKLAQWAGADTQEKTALAYSIFAFWRQEYDHTSEYAYHTFHEIMDVAKNFGVRYQMSPATMYDYQYERVDILEKTHASYQAAVRFSKNLIDQINAHKESFGQDDSTEIRAKFGIIKDLDARINALYEDCTRGIGDFNEKIKELLALMNDGIKTQVEIKTIVDRVIDA